MINLKKAVEEYPELLHDRQRLRGTLKTLIRKVSVRASEFQSHSKQSTDTITSAEEDSASIVKDVVKEITGGGAEPVANTPIDVSIDPSWGNW